MILRLLRGKPSKETEDLQCHLERIVTLNEEVCEEVKNDGSQLMKAVEDMQTISSELESHAKRKIIKQRSSSNILLDLEMQGGGTASRA